MPAGSSRGPRRCGSLSLRRIGQRRSRKRAVVRRHGWLLRRCHRGSHIPPPEAADAESAFSGWEPVVGPRLVAVDQLASGELLVDAGASGTHPRVCAFDVAVERQGQQARVHLFSIEGARVTPYPLVVPMSLDLLPDLVPFLAEEVDRDLQIPGFVHLDEAIERDPAQYLRVGVMESAGASLPNALIRFAPAPAHRAAQTVEHPARVAVEAPAAIQEPGCS